MPAKASKSDAESLSAQLQTQGYLSSGTLSILTLPLFTPPSNSSSNVLSAFATYRAQHQKAIDQLTKCMWAMLNAKTTQQDTLDQMAAKEQVVQYELERTKTLLERERKLIATAEREREAERAKVKAAERALATEKEKARMAREELAKSKNMLAFVRTQAAQEAKRHEAELASASAKTQKGISESMTHRMTVLNPVSRRHRSERETNGEAELLETALAECDEARKEAERECVSLRELLKEVRDWTDDVARIRGVPALPAEPKMSGPFPHIVMPCPTLRSQTLARLDHLSQSFSQIVRTVDDQIISARAELEDLLEAERIGRAEEKARTGEAQRKLQEAERAIEEIEARLVDLEAVTSALRHEKDELDSELKEEASKAQVAQQECINLQKKLTALDADLRDVRRREESDRKKTEAEQMRRAARAAEKAKSSTSISQVPSTAPVNKSTPVEVHSSSRESPASDENAAPAPRQARSSKSAKPSALAGILALGDSPASAPMVRDVSRPALASRTAPARSTPAAGKANSVKTTTSASTASQPRSSARDLVERVRREREERQRREAA